MIDRSLLTACAAQVGVTLTAEAADRLDTYASLLVSWNERMNLTAITDPYGIVVRHFTDSLTLLPLLPEGPVFLIDVGTGAGFPGVVLAAARPGIRLTLLDSLQKRLTFLEELCRTLEIPVTLVHARAEEGGRRPELRERFDVATARAVAALPTLCEYCLPFVRTGGRFLAMKGPSYREEGDAAAAARLCGGELRDTQLLTLPHREGEPAESRALLIFDKIAPTPTKYPRTTAKIAKSPLK